MKKSLKLTCRVTGDGYWGAGECTVTGQLRFKTYEPDDNTTGFAEARFYLDDWDADEQGLIYSDSLFIQDLQDGLNRLGIAGRGIDYSESGMQGDDYVSMDASYELARDVRDRGYDITLPNTGPRNRDLHVETTRTKDELIDECIELLKQAAATC